MKKLKPEEIELLLKKGMLGLLEQQGSDENDVEVDVDKIIEKSRVANYSFINGNYSFAKGNFSAQAPENRVLLDDPDFWQKVFKDSDKPTQRLLQELEEKVEKGLFKLFVTQKEFVLKLSEELHSYLVNRVKKDDFSPDIENQFEELLQKLSDQPDLKPQIEEIVIQLRKDLKKKSRRVKLIDEKFFRNAMKKKTERDSPKPSSSPKPSNEEEIYNSDPDFSDHRDLKKKQKKGTCCFCRVEKPNFRCKSRCHNYYHTKCLSKFLKEKLPEINEFLQEDKLTENEVDLQLSIEGECFFCINRIGVCHECKRFGRIILDPKLQPNETQLHSELLLRCQDCSWFYHWTCHLEKRIDQSEDKLICNQHFCCECKEKGKNNLYECIECPNSYHKKCMGKKAKSINNFMALCSFHKKSEKPKKKEKGQSKDENGKQKHK